MNLSSLIGLKMPNKDVLMGILKDGSNSHDIKFINSDILDGCDECSEDDYIINDVYFAFNQYINVQYGNNTHIISNIVTDFL